MARVIGRIFDTSGQYPIDWMPQDAHHGLIIEPRGSRFVVHQGREIGAVRFDGPVATEIDSLPYAVRFRPETMFGDDMGGVAIDQTRCCAASVRR